MCHTHRHTRNYQRILRSYTLFYLHYNQSHFFLIRKRLCDQFHHYFPLKDFYKRHTIFNHFCVFKIETLGLVKRYLLSSHQLERIPNTPRSQFCSFQSLCSVILEIPLFSPEPSQALQSYCFLFIELVHQSFSCITRQ